MPLFGPRGLFQWKKEREAVQVTVIDIAEGATGSETLDGCWNQYITVEDDEGCRGVYHHYCTPDRYPLVLSIGDTLRVVLRRHKVFSKEVKVLALT